MGDSPTFQFFFIIRQPSFEISIPALLILRKNYRKILCTYDHLETPFCVISRYQLGRDERQNLGTTWPQNWRWDHRARSIPKLKNQNSVDPKLNGSVRSNRKSFEITGPPFEMDHFSRSDRLEFWLNGSRPCFNLH